MTVIGPKTFDAYELGFKLDEIIHIDEAIAKSIPDDEHIFIGDTNRFFLLCKLIRRCNIEKYRREHSGPMEFQFYKSNLSLLNGSISDLTTDNSRDNELSQFERYLSISTHVNETWLLLDYRRCDNIWWQNYKWYYSLTKTLTTILFYYFELTPTYDAFRHTYTHTLTHSLTHSP